MQRSGTPTYVIRESSRINALESTVLQMATDLTTSKDEIKEVKELLLRLINPIGTGAPAPHATAPTVNPVVQLQNSASPFPDPSITARQSREARGEGSLNPERSTAEATPVVQRVPPTGQLSPPSWASGDTVPVTPNSLLQRFTNPMPIGVAVSTDVSLSTATTSNGLSPNSIRSERQSPIEPRVDPIVNSIGPDSEAQNSIGGVTTRGRAVEAEREALPRAPRPRFEIGHLPRITSSPIAANSLCYILHPDHGDIIVAEGRAGGSWKSPSQKLGSLCAEGEQMVQVHKIIKPNLPLVFIEERQSFRTLDQALVKSSGSSVYVKWQSRLLIKKAKASPRV